MTTDQARSLYETHYGEPPVMTDNELSEILTHTSDVLYEMHRRSRINAESIQSAFISYHD